MERMEIRNRSLRYRSSITMVLSSYSILGVLFSFSAIIVFAVRQLNINLDKADQFILMVAATSALISVASFLALNYLKGRAAAAAEEQILASQAFRLLSIWSAFEAVASSVLGEDLSDKPVPTRSLIFKLFEGGHLSLLQAEELEQALEVRNSVAHYRPGTLSPLLVQQAVSSLEEVVQSLQKIAAKAKRRAI